MDPNVVNDAMRNFRPSRQHREPIADCPQPDGRELKLADIVHPDGTPHGLVSLRDRVRAGHIGRDDAITQYLEAFPELTIADGSIWYAQAVCA